MSRARGYVRLRHHDEVGPAAGREFVAHLRLQNPTTRVHVSSLVLAFVHGFDRALDRDLGHDFARNSAPGFGPCRIEMLSRWVKPFLK